MMKKSFTTATIVLMVLTALRTITQFIIAMRSLGTTYEYSYLITGIVYLISFVGLVRKKRWGAILVLVFAVLDILIALSTGGASAFGAGLVDLIIVWLAYLAYKADGIPLTTPAQPPSTENHTS